VLKRLERVRSMQLGLFAGAATLAVGVQSDRYFILRQRYPARAAKPEPSSIIEDGSGRGLGPTPKVPVPPVGIGGLPDCVMVAVIVCYLRQSRLIIRSARCDVDVLHSGRVVDVIERKPGEERTRSNCSTARSRRFGTQSFGKRHGFFAFSSIPLCRTVSSELPGLSGLRFAEGVLLQRSSYAGKAHTGSAVGGRGWNENG
jgi:hypothetical protein